LSIGPADENPKGSVGKSDIGTGVKRSSPNRGETKVDKLSTNKDVGQPSKESDDLLGDYTYIADLVGIMPQMADDTIISRTFLDEENVKGILFRFAAGQELSEHTASRPAVLHFLQGEAELTLGPDSSTARAGTWVHMPAHLPHSVLAKTPVVMILLLVR
jgi:quercetin dioxygenase-like cupin family protein